MAENGTPGNTETNPPNNAPANAAAEPPDWYKNPPAWMSTPPQQAAPQQNAGAGAGPSQARNDLLTTLNALPDRIIDGIREAFPTAPAQSGGASAPPAAQPPAQPPAQPAGPPAESKPGKSGSFAEWWFGG